MQQTEGNLAATVATFLRDLYLFLLTLNILERMSSSEFIFEWMRWYVIAGTTYYSVKLVTNFFSSGFKSFSHSDSSPGPPQRMIGPRTQKTTRSGVSDPSDPLNLEFAVSEMQGWREAMEDCSVSLTNLDHPLEGIAMFSVFDGHGGATVSKFCSQSFPSELLKQAKTRGDSDLESILTATYVEIDNLILAAGAVPPGGRVSGSVESPEGRIERKNLYDFTGCTAVTALITRDLVTVANAGDSRCLLCRGGEAIELSHDHKPESPRERSRIEKAGGKVTAIGPCFRVDWGLNLSRSLGDFAYKRNDELPASEQKISSSPDIVTERLRSEDEFIVSFFICLGLISRYWVAMEFSNY
jgi:protein phosphatase 1G